MLYTTPCFSINSYCVYIDTGILSSSSSIVSDYSILSIQKRCTEGLRSQSVLSSFVACICVFVFDLDLELKVNGGWNVKVNCGWNVKVEWYRQAIVCDT